jgi:hypothetical protein
LKENSKESIQLKRADDGGNSVFESFERNSGAEN